METEFECNDVEYVNRGFVEMQKIKPVMFLSWLSSDLRLVAILRNIVDNDGEFKPVAPSDEVLALYQTQRKLPEWKAPRGLRSPRTSVTVTVTADMIAKGDPNSPDRHPVALALHRAGLRRWSMGATEFYVGKSSKPRAVPESVMDFLDLYDSHTTRNRAKPFTFEVALKA
jgi:hypothetical protein